VAGDASGEDASGETSLPPAGDASSSDGAAFCEGRDATFCEDFDLADGGYRYVYDITVGVEAGCSLATDRTTSTSPPRSLRVSVPGGADNSGQLAGLWTVLGQAHRVVHAFDVRVEPYDVAGAGSGVLFEMISVYTSAGDDRMEFRFRLSSAGLVYEAHSFLPQNVVDTLQLPANALAPGAWHHVEVDLTLDPPAHAHIQIDDNAPVDGTFLRATNGGGTTKLTLGIFYPENGTGAWALHVDNATAQVY
jgi:hypothetical protein